MLGAVVPQVPTRAAPFGRGRRRAASAAFNWLEGGLEVQQASGAILDGATSGLGAREKELLWSRVGKHSFMKTQVLTLCPLGMIGSGQVGQSPGETHMLPRWVGRQSVFATNPLPGSPLLAPSAQSEELPVHQFRSLEVKAEDDTSRRKMAGYPILQKSGPRHSARLKELSNIVGALLRKHGVAHDDRRI